jgi:acetyl esterase/lipase
MASWRAHALVWLLKRQVKRPLARATSVAQVRAAFGSGRLPTPKGVRITPASVGAIPGEWVEPVAGGTIATLLYLHGGGYVGCSPATHRPITGAYALAGFRVFAPDYRLAPEHPFPAAVDDSIAAYRGLLAEGTAPNLIAVAGDSAGGGLALALLLALKDAGTPLPAAATLLSPFTDLAATGESITRNVERCAMLYGPNMTRVAALYLGTSDPTTPLASPLYGDLGGLPPLLIQVGADEVLLDDSVRVAEKARAAGTEVELTIWPVVPHVWQLFHGFLPEGRQALAQSATFMKGALA